MENLLLSFSVVFPLFVYMLLGLGIRRMGLLKEADFKALNRVVFRLFISTMLFISIYKSDLKASIDKNLFVEVVILVLAIYAVLCLTVPRVVKEKKDAAVIIQGIYRSNYVLFGITIGAGLYKNGDIGVIAALAAFVIPLYNILSVLLFEMFRGNKVNGKHLIGEMMRNPLVIAGLLGILASFLNIRLPVLIVDTLSQIGNMASPLALICLGGMLSFTSMKCHKKQLGAVLLGRLVIIPAIAILIGVLSGYRDVALTAILAVFGSPTAVASAPMAQEMGGNADLAGEVVVTTSAGCIFTMFLFILILKNLGYIT